jgi:hypothetical protein
VINSYTGSGTRAFWLNWTPPVRLVAAPSTNGLTTSSVTVKVTPPVLSKIGGSDPDSPGRPPAATPTAAASADQSGAECASPGLDAFSPSGGRVSNPGRRKRSTARRLDREADGDAHQKAAGPMGGFEAARGPSALIGQARLRETHAEKRDRRPDLDIRRSTCTSPANQHQSKTRRPSQRVRAARRRVAIASGCAPREGEPIRRSQLTLRSDAPPSRPPSAGHVSLDRNRLLHRSEIGTTRRSKSGLNITQSIVRGVEWSKVRSAFVTQHRAGRVLCSSRPSASFTLSPTGRSPLKHNAKLDGDLM